MTGYTQLINIIDELKETGVTPKVTKLPTKKAPKRSLLSRSKWPRFLSDWPGDVIKPTDTN